LLPGLATSRDEIEEAPRQVFVRIDIEDPLRQHVESVEIVKKPAVQAQLAECGLDRFEIEHSLLLEVCGWWA
jgi:hypothetical protein